MKPGTVHEGVANYRVRVWNRVGDAEMTVTDAALTQKENDHNKSTAITCGACTIVAHNYLPYAKVLQRSFEQFNPGVTFTTLIVDGTEDDRSIPGIGRVVLPSDLGMNTETLHSMMMIYDVMEISTALKPSLLMMLIRSGSDSVCYLDPDIQVFGSLADVFDDAWASRIALTPRTSSPIRRDGLNISEQSIMAAGMFNLGFIAASAKSYSFLSWWHERLETDAISDPTNQLFTDQRWLDWAPSFFDVKVLRDPGLNVAYWNLHDREFTRREDGGLDVNGHPLRFFHFSGYSPEYPWVLSKYLLDKPRVLLSEQPHVKQLCDLYGQALRAEGLGDGSQRSYGYARTPDGIELTRELRRFLRAVITRSLDTAPPPDAFDQPAAFRDWLLDDFARIGAVAISRAEYAHWFARDDLRAAFPQPTGGHIEQFSNWLNAKNPTAELTGEQVRPQVKGESKHRNRGSSSIRDLATSWSILGFFESELGVGEAGRRLARAVQTIGVPTTTVDMSELTLSRRQHYARTRGEWAGEVARNVIVCANADMLPSISQRYKLRTKTQKLVGLWFWELSDFPDRFDSAFRAVDEVWVASEFTQNAIAKKTHKPVRIVPLPVPRFPTNPLHDRKALGLPEDKKIFLVSFDFASALMRKNPQAAIKAYRQAFEPNDNALLLIKTINGHRWTLELERLLIEAADRPDIVVQDGYLSCAKMISLIANVDCLVSLHRSEGYGIHLADAMALGTSTIATGYSGNMTFMDESTSLLVGYDLCEVGDDAAPYQPGATWANPHIDAAIGAMRHVVDQPERTKAMELRAQKHIQKAQSLSAAWDAMSPTLLPFLVPDGRKHVTCDY